MPEVVIYTKTGCPYCKKAIEDYKTKGIQFKEINTSDNPEAKSHVKNEYGVNKVPVIIEDGKLVSTGYGGGG